MPALTTVSASAALTDAGRSSGKAPIGLQVDQVSVSPRPSQLLQVEMTGRGALPRGVMAGQPTVLLDERYRLTGQCTGDRLRSSEGLVSALRCASGGERFAQSEAFGDTQRQWRRFELDFEVPLVCAGAVRLQLEVAAAREDKADIDGTMYFDNFELRPLGAGGAAR